MKRVIMLALFAGIAANAQQTVQGTCSVVIPAGAGLPAGMSFDGITLTVAKLSATQLTLTGGPSLTSGTIYGLEPQPSGPALWVPIPTSTSAAAPTYLTVVIPALANVVPAGVAKASFALPAGRSAIGVIGPDPGDGWVYEVYAGVVKVRNLTGTSHPWAATTVRVAIQ